MIVTTAMCLNSSKIRKTLVFKCILARYMHILHHKRIIEVIQNIQPRTVYLTHNPLIIKYTVQKYSSLTKMPILLTLLHIFCNRDSMSHFKICNSAFVILHINHSVMLQCA